MENGVNPGLWLESMAPGLITNYEEHSARIEAGINIERWMAMDVDEKAMIVAVRRTTNAIHNLTTEAEIEMAKKKSHKA